MSGPVERERRASNDDVRSHIVNSLFWRKAEDGTPEETLISFTKVYEEDPGDVQAGAKTRYLMLAVTRLGKVVIHKAKRNANLSFSKGKTWNLEDMRAVEVIGPTDFALTMTVRRYHWTTERSKDQTQFLNSVVKVYRTYTKGEVPELINFSLPSAPVGNGHGNGSGPPHERRPSASAASASSADGRPSSVSSIPVPSLDLMPPPLFKTARSGSSSSVHSSGLSSSYNPSEGSQPGSRGRTTPVGPGTPHTTSTFSNFEDQRTPTASSFNRGAAPGDPTIPPARRLGERRPSADARNGHGSGNGHNGQETRDAHDVGPIGLGVGAGIGATGAGIGLGLPSHLRDDRGREISEASSYRDPSRSLRSPDVESLREGDAPNRPQRSNMRISRDLAAPSRGAAGAGPTDSPSIRSEAKVPSQLAPTITTTLASPSIPSDSTLPVPDQTKDQKVRRRASFHPPPLATAFSREVLLTSRTGVLPGAPGLTVDEGETAEDAVMASVEEMLEGFDWTATASVSGLVGGEGGRKKGSADAIESRLLDELAALDSANIHAFLESDDRIAQVLGHIDEALLELDDIDMQITGYRMQLNAVSDDISFIESQNRGLQVQTSNQQALLNELRQLLQIVEVPDEDLRILLQESPGTQRGVQLLEQAATSLYKALQAGMDTANAEVAATIARMKEYQENSAQFCKRILDYLEITFKYQSDQTFAEYRKSSKKALALTPHTSMGQYLMTYEGLVLYVKEMDEDRYQRLCSNYMGSVSQLHSSEMKDLLMNYIGTLNSMTAGEANEAAFTTAAKSDVPRASAFQKSRAAIGLKANANDPVNKEKKASDNSQRVGELYQKALSEVINQIVVEEDFINAFLHLTDTESTFADHMQLDSYFRRQAARHATRGMSPGMVQLVRSMMDLIFGFVDGELKNWVEAATVRNPVSIVGVIGVTERLAKEAEQENTSMFFAQMFDKLIARQHAALDIWVNEQVKVIDAARMSVKRRKGVAFFVKHFPVFVERMEAQLEGSDDLAIRSKVNGIYERIVNAIFGSLQQLAKMDRAEGQAAEDKGQLNYHVIMIENMHHFIDDVGHLDVTSLGVFLERAKGMYDDNLSGYLKVMLRRSFGRIMDFFDGVERLLRTTPANEVSLHQSYSRSALKKMLKDFTSKDMRKAVETMSRRVDKHFTADDDGSSIDPATAALIQSVWKALTAELKRETRRDADIIAKSYGDSGLSLEFGQGDVEAACKRMK